MGLYFKNMEMVNSCRECPTMCDALIEYCNNGERIPYDRRLDECPIVEITIPRGDSVTTVIDRIKALPSAEAVQVVRCKDCYHAEDDITNMFCVYFHHKVYGDDYCSNAVKRREDGEA